jgi:hypothetical protein
MSSKPEFVPIKIVLCLKKVHKSADKLMRQKLVTPDATGKHESDILSLLFLDETCAKCAKGQHEKCLGSFCSIDSAESAASHVACNCRCHETTTRVLKVSPQVRASHRDAA